MKEALGQLRGYLAIDRSAVLESNNNRMRHNWYYANELVFCLKYHLFILDGTKHIFRTFTGNVAFYVNQV